MADINYTVRRVVLPVSLLDGIKTYLDLKEKNELKAHHLLELCIKKINSFDEEAVRVTGIAGYREFISTVFSEKSKQVVFFFKKAYWNAFLAIQGRLNIGAGDVVRLLLSTYLFPSGETTLPLSELADIFINGKQDYQYNLMITKPVSDLLSASINAQCLVNRETIIRASQYYFSKGLGIVPSIPLERYRITNTTTGWSRLTVSGSHKMKEYFQAEKRKTGKSIGLLMVHTIHSFLSIGRGINGDE
jgi:hypothetical protein